MNRLIANAESKLVEPDDGAMSTSPLTTGRTAVTALAHCRIVQPVHVSTRATSPKLIPASASGKYHGQMLRAPRAPDPAQCAAKTARRTMFAPRAATDIAKWSSHGQS